MDKDFATTGYGVVLVTASSQEEAEKIAQNLVQSRLAACVSLMPVHSIYTWQGKVNSEQEWHLVIKTDLAHFSTLEAKIRELHSYEVPEIIALPILAGSQPYLQWISDNVNEI
ncbi:divalent-cation tolerance protein CutA [Funiculus sociatus GB2-A5]|uniref:Divalent-cation tolerance protein CutA n=1 Tax=Funiculus sociatus GB2-A5 TaxID=2933946 RepID=A0ABV0JIY1_9CYAN|nr:MULTISPECIES: divalent-cation tolerance protein CutA [unclassified Trichocoleus]MBD1904471.1 divalent-cation tolerance protein CutA [Trichocoleus sp. FACHB-832]MBD2064402.1 divalent-cation tolerance protein CutA [Trichocoleus sp. FACHB-6]